MAIEVVPPVATPEAPTFTTVLEPVSFDERWAAWQARGVARDRAVRRKTAIAAPILIIVAAVIISALRGR